MCAAAYSWSWLVFMDLLTKSERLTGAKGRQLKSGRVVLVSAQSCYGCLDMCLASMELLA